MVLKACSVQGQSAPLQQRLSLLESYIADSPLNAGSGLQDGVDIAQLMAEQDGGRLIVVDLTDPLLSPEEANSIFQVTLQQFREKPVRGGGGKLVCLDEAHKYRAANDGLSKTIVDMARLMRHDGIRLALSTQSPKSLAPELLELVTIALMHNFHSYDWFAHLAAKIPLPRTAFDEIQALSPGRALTFVSRHSINARARNAGADDSVDSSALLRVVVRPRVTADFGTSKRNLQRADA